MSFGKKKFPPLPIPGPPNKEKKPDYCKECGEPVPDCLCATSPKLSEGLIIPSFSQTKYHVAGKQYLGKSKFKTFDLGEDVKSSLHFFGPNPCEEIKLNPLPSPTELDAEMKAHYQSLKGLTFGAMYGMAPHKIAMGLQDQKNAAKQLHETFNKFFAPPQVHPAPNTSPKTWMAQEILGKFQDGLGAAPQLDYSSVKAKVDYLNLPPDQKSILMLAIKGTMSLGNLPKDQVWWKSKPAEDMSALLDNQEFSFARVPFLVTESVDAMRNGKTNLVIAAEIATKLPPCCTYPNAESCLSAASIMVTMTGLAKEHSKHTTENRDVTSERLWPLYEAFLTVMAVGKMSREMAVTWFNAHLPTGAPMITIDVANAPKSIMAASYLTVLGDFLREHEEAQGYVEPTAIEVVELTISGLTPQEAEAVLKNLQKTKSQALVATKKMKDIGTGAKGIIHWEFESASMVSNGQPVKYIAQLNDDGTLSCQCRGWTQGSVKATGKRFCKHTKAIEAEVDVMLLYKKWKKGESLGSEFVPVGSGSSSGPNNQSTSTVKPAITYTAKRIVDI